MPDNRCKALSYRNVTPPSPSLFDAGLLPAARPCSSDTLLRHLCLFCRAMAAPTVPLESRGSDSVQRCTSRQLMSVAPMMDWTDVYFRQLARLISKHTWLYTEMVVVRTL